jgi:hypothetical protein
MAGSRKWFEYETDGGQVFAVNMDESNGEAVGNSDYTALSTAVFALPRNVVPRTARYTSSNPPYQRSIIVGTAGTTTTDLPASITAPVEGQATGVLLALASFQGERFNAIPREDDTGLNDGDAT